MIKIENTEVFGWEAAIRGMRNPMNSWERSDSFKYQDNCDKKSSGIWIGENDVALMKKLASAGSVHGKFRRMINVTFDCVAPLYLYKEMDTYKIGTVCNSCSTMHKIHAKEFTLDDFSHEYLEAYPLDVLERVIQALNIYRNDYLKAKEDNEPDWAKHYWWQMIQLLPSSYNQRRTYQMNYEVLANIYE